ncbi:prepilin peptidase [Coxiella burnetii]
MQIISFLQFHFYITIVAIAVIGLIVGSFLNVVIVRYPTLLAARWRRECQEYLNLPVEPKPKFNLATPRSQCPRCKKTLKIRHNLPLISYLTLRARCAYCHEKISPLYPIVELLCAILSVAIVIRYQISWQALAGLLLTWVLIVLFFIDLKTQLLPDAITLPTLWFGLSLSLFYMFVSPYQAIFGAILGYGLLWITAAFYQLIRKKGGMGRGDFKMVSMLGAWFGPVIVLNVLLLAVFLGLITSFMLLALKKISVKQPIPFAPFIAVAGWISLLSGPVLIHKLISYL